ncbi:MAG: DUF1844 domain-containing protein [Kiritimatiellaeota bacterium]|nr:DUF1844 domain-containing protein [Kiritimatiellota bacterium]
MNPLQVLEQSNAQVQRFVLANGLLCLVKEDHSAPVAAVQIWVGSGAVHEDEFLGGGLSHFVEHMIFKGTPARPPGAIMREASDLGGKINAYTAQDRTVFHLTLPARHWSAALDILSDAVMQAAFPADEWAREREVILREMAMGRDNPDRELSEMLWGTAYRVHPYRVPVIGYESVFKARTRADLLNYFHRNYTPDNMIVVVTGDVPARAVAARLRQVFAPFERRARRPVLLPAEPPQMAARSARQTGHYNISRLAWAYHTVPLSHPDAPALDVLAALAGSGRSSRLVQELKEKQKLVYEIDAWSFCPKDPGLFGINAGFDSAKEAAVLRAVQAELDTWAARPFPKKDIEKVRRQVLLAQLAELQGMEGQAASLASGEFYAGNARFSEQYLRAINEVTAAQLQAVARRYLKPENRSVVVLAPETAAPPEAAASAAVVKAPVKLQLKSGVPLIVREDHRLPLVYVCAAVRGGLLTETTATSGITQLASDLLVRGTEKRSAAALARQVEQMGAALSPFAGRNSFGLQGHCLAQDAGELLDLFSDALLNSICPADEVEKQRALQLAAIQQQREQPFFIAEEALRQTLYRGHPYQGALEGRTESVQALTRAALRRHLQRHIVRGNLALAIFGDVTPAQARALAERSLRDLPPGESPVGPLPPASPTLPASLTLHEPRQQTIVLLGFPGLRLTDPRTDALALIEEALSGLSSDLGNEVREKRGLVYYVGASHRPGLAPGMFMLYAGTRAGQEAEVVRLMDEQLRRLAEQGPRADEMQRAREQLLAESQLSLQYNAGLAQACVLNELYGLGYDYSLRLPGRRTRSGRWQRNCFVPTTARAWWSCPRRLQRKRIRRKTMANDPEFSMEDVHSAMFAQLVMMFTSATLQHLGKLVNPATHKAEINLEAAQASIDMLAMLEVKTRGNLKPDEARLLKESLTQLQLNYVETQQAAGAPPAPEPAPAEPPASAPAAAPGDIQTPPAGDDKQPKFHKKY